MKLARLVAGAAAVATAATLATGCASPTRPISLRLTDLRGVAAVEPTASAVPYAAADLAFGLDVLSAWCAQDPTGNIVLSPASLASGLGMAYLGARGRTAAAMAAALHLPTRGSLAAGLQARSHLLNGLDGRGLSVAEVDRVWSDPKLQPLHSYLDAVATGYDAGIGRVPLLTDPSQAAADIDRAISMATHGHIPKLLSAADIGGAVFVLTDALYLNARWARVFKPSQTSLGVFASAGGQQVPAHYLAGGDYPFASYAGWTAVSLPYQGGRLSMTALLPSDPSADEGCPDLTPGVVRSIDSALARPNQLGVAIRLPEVKLSTSRHMNGLLTKLGMGIAFSSLADFSGMSPQAASLGAVVHAATLSVGAAGTTASAATGVAVLPSSGEVGPAISFDRPYLMVITDTRTGEPLFLARVANPALP